MSLQLRTRVPASTANLGPGYDILGLALDWPLAATATPSAEWLVITRGEGAGLLGNSGENLIARACRRACRTAGWEDQPLRVESDNPIPIARGLGSSAAAIVTGMALAHLLNLGRIEKDALFQAAAALEGHPDNIAAAVYGGLQESVPTGSGFQAHPRPLDGAIRVLVVVPGTMKSTAELRRVVPVELSPEDRTATAAALRHVLAGLAEGDPAGLRYSEEDRRHQPYRLAVQPESRAIFRLLQSIPEVAGAFLSGAGTTVAGWVVDTADPAPKVEQALRQQSITAKVRIVRPDLKGVEGSVHNE